MVVVLVEWTADLLVDKMDVTRVRLKVEHLERTMVVLKVVWMVDRLVDNLALTMECKMVDLMEILSVELKEYLLE
jgi:hypothetical protein